MVVFPAVAGFWIGILFLLLLDKTIPHLHLGSVQPEGIKIKLKKTTMLVLAVALHNIPEGMAVGVLFASWLSGNGTIAMAGAMIYVVVEELIPEMSVGEHSNLGTVFFALGFTVMLALDVALGGEDYV